MPKEPDARTSPPTLKPMMTEASRKFIIPITLHPGFYLQHLLLLSSGKGDGEQNQPSNVADTGFPVPLIGVFP